jgi:hypothetical protein
MKPISPSNKQHQMGDVSNLITDMTIRGANSSELAQAVRHSMVVIDSEKHKSGLQGVGQGEWDSPSEGEVSGYPY